MFDFILKQLCQKSSFLGVEWAPLLVPTQRRLQTLAAVVCVCIVLLGEGLSVYLFVKLLVEWVRNWSIWHHYRAYFPINLIKTKELDPSKNYIFACYPHGLMSQSPMCCFSTNALDFNSKFPGLNINFATLGGHFLVPFFRDFILSLGMRSCDEDSLLYFLDGTRYEGNCVVLVIGGAAEAMFSHPGKYKVILNKRKGFIRVAITSGASLVPVFSFGEPDIFKPFENPEESLLRRFQETVKRWTGVSPVFSYGRGIFQYSYGLLPLRNPITTVVGAPIDVKRNLEPTDQEIDEVHAQFTHRLIELFETEKKNYLKNYEDVRLEIV